MTKVLITVKDGYVHEIASNTKDLKIIVLDLDAQDEPGYSLEEQDLDFVDKNVYNRFYDKDDPIHVKVKEELHKIDF